MTWVESSCWIWKAVFFLWLQGLFAITAQAQDSPVAEVFGGYSYLRLGPAPGWKGIFLTGPVVAPSSNLNGWKVSVAGFFSKQLGAQFEVSGYYGEIPTVSLRPFSDNIIRKDSFSQMAFLGGPVAKILKSRQVDASLVALFGGSKGNLDENEFRPYGAGLDGSHFVASLGGSVDFNLNHRVAFRVAPRLLIVPGLIIPPADSLRRGTLKNFQLSAGFVVRFGKR